MKVVEAVCKQRKSQLGCKALYFFASKTFLSHRNMTVDTHLDKTHIKALQNLEKVLCKWLSPKANYSV